MHSFEMKIWLWWRKCNPLEQEATAKVCWFTNCCYYNVHSTILLQWNYRKQNTRLQPM